MCLCTRWPTEGSIIQVLPTPAFLKGSKQTWVGSLWHLTLIQQRTDSVSERNICIISRKLQQGYGISRNYSLTALENLSVADKDYNQKVLTEHKQSIEELYHSRCWLHRAVVIWCRLTSDTLFVFENIFWILKLTDMGEKATLSKTEVCISFFRGESKIKI